VDSVSKGQGQRVKGAKGQSFWEISKDECRTAWSGGQTTLPHFAPFPFPFRDVPPNTRMKSP